MKIVILFFCVIFLGFNSIEKESVKEPKFAYNFEITESHFYAFIWEFMSNEDFQLSRTKIKNWKYINYFKDYDYTIHFFPSFKLSHKEFLKDVNSVKHLAILDSNRKIRTELVFKKINGKWFLISREYFDFNLSNVTGFESFIYRFSKDSVFQKIHIKFPLKHVYLDHETDYDEKTVYLDETTVYNYDFFDNNGKLMFFHDAKFRNSKQIIIFLRGIDGGFNNYYYFERIENEWIPVEDVDAST